MPLRPLVDHERSLPAWTVPVHGHDAYQVAVGPIHAGVIESGHFRFHVVGDLILQLDARLFYKHRGLERAAEGRTLDAGRSRSSPAPARPARSRTASRYAHACEEALGLDADARSSRVRERSCSSSSGRGTTSTTSPQSAQAQASRPATATSRRSRSRRDGSTHALTGHRFLFGSGPRRRQRAHARPRKRPRAPASSLGELRREAERGWRSLLDQLSRSRTGSRASGSSQPRRPAGSGRSGPRLRAAGVRRRRPGRLAPPRLRRLRDRRPGAT